jgi:hypothetical protein
MRAIQTNTAVPLLVGIGAILLFAAYWSIFALTTEDGVARGAVQAFNNTLPAIVLAWLTHLVLDRHVWTARPALRFAVQIPLALLFALAWYLAILVIRQLRGDWIANGFEIQPFVPIAFAWQMFQGVTFYALTAVSSLAIVLHRRLTAVTDAERAEAAAASAPVAPDTILVRTPEGSEAIPIESITTISGAGDYSELALPGRTLLSTTTLAEFESRLPPGRFLRAHRSHIVRLGAVVRSEPIGNGRTAIHLADGRAITTSRAGTRFLREAAL